MEKKREASPVRKWGPASDAWLKVFSEVSAGLGESRKMFGYPCVFVNGQLFAGVHQENIMIRLSEADREAFLALDGAARFEPMPGRPMREYVVAPQLMIDSPDELVGWLEKSYAYAKTLPPK